MQPLPGTSTVPYCIGTVPVVYLTSYYFRFNTVTTSHPLIHPPPPAPQFITKYDNDTNQHLSKLKSAGLPSFQKKRRR